MPYGVTKYPCVHKHHEVIDHAKTFAQHSTMIHKHAAVLTYNGKIIGCGINRSIHNINSNLTHNISIHAEIAAVSDCVKRFGSGLLQHAVLYVIRIGPNGLKFSEPCKHCTEVIQRNNIKTVYYSTDTKSTNDNCHECDCCHEHELLSEDEEESSDEEPAKQEQFIYINR